MTKPRFLTHRDAEEAGWFSRRHETADAHREASARHKRERGRAARQRRAAERLK